MPKRPPASTPAGAAALVFLLLGAWPATGRAQCSLTNATTWCAHQDSAGVSGGAEDDDRFGAALALGDFNGDGFDDLAVGAPGENNDAGVVYVFYSNGLIPVVAGHQILSQDNLGGADEGAENGDELGASLAAGDFNHDGRDDLAIGSPGEDLPEPSSSDCTLFQCEDAGGVHVIYGSLAGLLLSSSTFFSNSGFFPGNAPDELSRLGATLVTADFDGDGVDDLVAGKPLIEPVAIDTGPEHGQAIVAFGAPGGLATGDEGFVLGLHDEGDPCSSSESPRRFGAAVAAVRAVARPARGLAIGASHCMVGSTAGTGAVFFDEVPEPFTDADDVFLQTSYSTASSGTDDHFGISLAAGDFDGSGDDDLAAGAPNRNHGAGNPNDSGRVYVAYNGGGGPDPTDLPDIIGEDEWAGDTPGEGEQFGSALAAGDVDGDGFDDLLAGAPGEGSFDVGRIYLKRGSATGLTTLGNNLFTQTFLGGSNGTDDHLGNVIALGDVDGDGILEIALGVPDKDVGTTTDGGMVYVTRAFGPNLFKDGFESGSKGAWSASTP